MLRLFAFILLCLIGWQAYDNSQLRGERNDALKAAQSAQDDAANLDRQIETHQQTAAAQADVASKQLKGLDLDRQHLQSELRAASQAKMDAEKKCEQLTADLEAAKKEASESAKAALKAARDSCPPPEVIPKETQAQDLAPMFQKVDGAKIWRTDWAWDESKAKELHRLQFVVFSTRSCPHCDWAMTQCSDQAIGKELFSKYVPAWITVQDKATYDLAESMGVNKFRYPAAMLRNPTTGEFELWRPSKDNAKLQDEIAEHAASLK